MQQKTTIRNAAGARDSGFSWLIAACCCFINMMMYGLARLSGVMFVASLDRFGVSRREASLPYSLSSTIRNLAGPLVGFLGQKFGVRTVTVCGCLVSSIGVGLCFLAQNIFWVTISWGVIFGLGFGLGNILLPVTINQYFDKHRASASGISFSGACLGSFLLPSLIEILLDNYGLSGTFLVMSGLTLNCIPAAMLLRKPAFVTELLTSETLRNSINYGVPDVDRKCVISNVHILSNTSNLIKDANRCSDKCCYLHFDRKVCRVTNENDNNSCCISDTVEHKDETAPKEFSSGSKHSISLIQKPIFTSALVVNPKNSYFSDEHSCPAQVDTKLGMTNISQQCAIRRFKKGQNKNDINKIIEYVDSFNIAENQYISSNNADFRHTRQDYEPIYCNISNPPQAQQTLTKTNRVAGRVLSAPKPIDVHAFVADISKDIIEDGASYKDKLDDGYKVIIDEEVLESSRNFDSITGKLFDVETKDQATVFYEHYDRSKCQEHSKDRNALILQRDSNSSLEYCYSNPNAATLERMIETEIQLTEHIECYSETNEQKDIPLEISASDLSQILRNDPPCGRKVNSKSERKALREVKLNDLKSTTGAAIKPKSPFVEKDATCSHSKQIELAVENDRMSEICRKVDKLEYGLNPTKTSNSLKERLNTNSFLISLKIFVDPMFILICVSVGIYAFTFVAVVTVVIDFANDIGIERYKGKYILMSFSVGDMIGRLGLGWITDRGYMTKTGFAAFCFLLQGMAATSIAWASGFLTLMIIMALYGIFEAGLIIIFPLIVAQYIDEEQHTIAIPSSNLLSAPFCMVVPPLIGFFREEIGTYDGVFYIVGVVSLICAIWWFCVPCIAKCQSRKANLE